MEYTTLVDCPDYFGLKTINLSSSSLGEHELIIEVKSSIGPGLFVLPDGSGYDSVSGAKTANFKNFTFASVQKAIDWYTQTQVNHKAFVYQPEFPHS